MSKQFRSGKRKDGSKYSFPITKKQTEVNAPSVKIVQVKSNPWGRFAQHDIKRERDLLPSVNPDTDYGWLAHMEKGFEDDYDRKEQAKIMRMLNVAKYGTNAQAAIALTKLEVEYPRVYHHFVGRKSEIKRPEPKQKVVVTAAAPAARVASRQGGKSASEVAREPVSELRASVSAAKEKIRPTKPVEAPKPEAPKIKVTDISNKIKVSKVADIHKAIKEKREGK